MIDLAKVFFMNKIFVHFLSFIRTSATKAKGEEAEKQSASLSSAVAASDSHLPVSAVVSAAAEAAVAAVQEGPEKEKSGSFCIIS